MLSHLHIVVEEQKIWFLISLATKSQKLMVPSCSTGDLGPVHKNLETVHFFFFERYFHPRRITAETLIRTHRWPIGFVLIPYHYSTAITFLISVAVLCGCVCVLFAVARHLGTAITLILAAFLCMFMCMTV